MKHKNRLSTFVLLSISSGGGCCVLSSQYLCVGDIEVGLLWLLVGTILFIVGNSVHSKQNED